MGLNLAQQRQLEYIRALVGAGQNNEALEQLDELISWEAPKPKTEQKPD